MTAFAIRPGVVRTVIGDDGCFRLVEQRYIHTGRREWKVVEVFHGDERADDGAWFSTRVEARAFIRDRRRPHVAHYHCGLAGASPVTVERAGDHR